VQAKLYASHLRQVYSLRGMLKIIKIGQSFTGYWKNKSATFYGSRRI